MSPKISAIIPLYNKGPHIARAINSVLSQTVQDFEIIVVDDHSSDEGPEIVKSYNDSRISFIEQDHHGVSYTRNHGVDLAKSDFIAFLDADDEWMPNHLEILLSLKIKYPQAGLYASCFVINESGKLIQFKNRMMKINREDGLIHRYFLVAAIDEPIITTAVGITKKIFYEMGGFPAEISYGEDMVLWGNIALKYPVAYSSNIGAIYHFDSVNRTSEIRDYHYSPYPFIEYAKKAIVKQEMTPQMLRDINEYIARKELYRAYNFLAKGNKQEATKIIATVKTRFFLIDKLKLKFLILLPSPIYKFLKTYRGQLLMFWRKL